MSDFAKKSEHQRRVETFMMRAKRALPAVPFIPQPEVLTLCLRLLWEELQELTQATGYAVTVIDSAGKQLVVSQDVKDLSFHKISSPNLPMMADGMGDVSVVNVYFMSACGISDESLLEAVDINNLEKFGPGGHLDDGGKWIKPPDHQPPDMHQVLMSQSGSYAR